MGGICFSGCIGFLNVFALRWWLVGVDLRWSWLCSPRRFWSLPPRLRACALLKDSETEILLLPREGDFSEGFERACCFWESGAFLKRRVSHDWELIKREQSKDTYSVEVVDDRNFVRELGLGVAEIDLASCYLGVLYLLNQMASHVRVFVGNEAEAPAGPSQGVAHDLGFLDLAPFLKVAREVVVTQLIIQTSHKDLFLNTTDRLALALKGLSLSVRPSRPIP